MNAATDKQFLTELNRQTDEHPAERVHGETVAAAIGLDHDEIEVVVQRLFRRKLLEWAPGPHRMSDGWTSRPIQPTAAGYEIVGHGLGHGQ